MTEFFVILQTKRKTKGKSKGTGVKNMLCHCIYYVCVCLQVYWFKDGKQISKRSEHYRISREPDGTCLLHTAAASLDDDGNYTIMASNPAVRHKRTTLYIIHKSE